MRRRMLQCWCGAFRQARSRAMCIATCNSEDPFVRAPALSLVKAPACAGIALPTHASLGDARLRCEVEA